MKTDTATLAARLRAHNEWRRSNEDTPEMINPALLGQTIAEAADRLEEMDRELAAERALADRLAETLGGLDWLGAKYPKALAAWKESRTP